MTTTRRKRPARILRVGQIPMFAGTTDDRRHDTAPPVPAQRHSRTSRAAARSMRLHAGQVQRRILRALAEAGPRGLTDREIQDLVGLSGDTERPARIRLVEAGLVIDSGSTRPTASSRRAAVWAAALHRQEAAA